MLLNTFIINLKPSVFLLAFNIEKILKILNNLNKNDSLEPGKINSGKIAKISIKENGVKIYNNLPLKPEYLPSKPTAYNLNIYSKIKNVPKKRFIRKNKCW